MDTSGTIPVKRNTDDAADLDLVCGRFVFAPDSGSLLFDAFADALHVRLSDQHAPSSLAGMGDILRREVPRSLGKAVFAVLQEFARDWTVGLLARQALMSRAPFARHFEAVAGTSPRELVTRLRIELARELLGKGKLSVGAVGEQV